MATACTNDGGTVMLMNRAYSLRLITTIDMDARFLTTFSFTFILGGSGCETAESGEDVYLSYSINGGVTWNLLMVLGIVIVEYTL